jgi:hypothetical protein
VLLGPSKYDFAPIMQEGVRYLICVDGSTLQDSNSFQWMKNYNGHERLGIHAANEFAVLDPRVLERNEKWVLVVHDEELDNIYYSMFPNVTGEIKSSLYRVDSPNYIRPPGRR